MKLTNIQVQNYRLLKDFSLDIEDELSLVIGKNNSGKTSLLTILNKFLNNGGFSVDDFNLDYKHQLYENIISLDLIEEGDYIIDGIKLRLFIEYGEGDDLTNISDLMMDLDADRNQIIINFEFVLTYEKFLQMKNDFRDFNLIDGADDRKFEYFFKNEYSTYYIKSEKSIKLNDVGAIVDFIDLKKENISLKNIINFKYISAKRDVSNRDIDKTLSSQTSKIYKKIESTPEQEEAINNFKNELIQTDYRLSENYRVIFRTLIDKVRRFGGIRDGESNISILSTLQHLELLDGNVTVTYQHGEHSLPESYNGLGYMNLISMIFEIEMLLNDFKKTPDEKPADINLLFIEEPEAHTHPQMQYIFIKNIKSLLENGIVREDGINRKIQYVISTHSSHIVSESNFNDIKYLKKKDTENSVISKNLRDLENEYTTNGEEQNYRFLKQYLTLNRSELFFADKAILIEGDTERILIPAMMKKIDNESNDEDKKLLSQNISIVEVGAHSKIFEKFIDFIGIKTLIITDIDSCKEVLNDEGRNVLNACKVGDEEVSKTSNSSLQFFFGFQELNNYLDRGLPNKIFQKNSGTREWELNPDGIVLITYQTNETNSDGVEYNARSFEDSFFHINKQFMVDNLDNFSFGIKNPRFMSPTHRSYIDDPYHWAEHCVDKKPSLAMEILMSSQDNDENQFTNWNTPSYIKEGLIWLRDN